MWGRSTRELAFSILWLIYPGGGTLILVTVDNFDTPTRYESSKTMTVTRMATATATCLIPVTVDTFGTPTRYESSKTMTVTRMATATLLTLFTHKYDMGAGVFFVLTLNVGPLLHFTNGATNVAVIYQSSQWCCLLYL